MDQEKFENLRTLSNKKKNVFVFRGDCNNVLLDWVFPNVERKDGKRGLCFLDPYGIQLDWNIIQKAGSMGTLEIMMNFSIMDMRRNVFRHKLINVRPSQIKRMDKFWGDSSWQHIKGVVQGDLFSEDSIFTSADDIVKAYVQRLKTKARFKFVVDPVPIFNSKNNLIYYLIFATQNKTGHKIVTAIFNKYKKIGIENGK